MQPNSYHYQQQQPPLQPLQQFHFPPVMTTFEASLQSAHSPSSSSPLVAPAAASSPTSNDPSRSINSATVFVPTASDGIIFIENIGLNTTAEAMQQLIYPLLLATQGGSLSPYGNDNDEHSQPGHRSSYDLALEYSPFIKNKDDANSNTTSSNYHNINDPVMYMSDPNAFPPKLFPVRRSIPLVVFKCDVFRGQGFVQLQNPEDVPAVVAALNNREYRTRMISARVSSYAERHHRLVAYAACVLAGGHIVRLRGLDFGITAERIRYFLQRQLAPVVVDGITIEITRHMCGTASGDAFLSALSVDNVRQILQLHMQIEGGRQIEVMEATHQDRARVTMRVGQRMALPWQARRAGTARNSREAQRLAQLEHMPVMQYPLLATTPSYRQQPFYQQQQQQQQAMQFSNVQLVATQPAQQQHQQLWQPALPPLPLQYAPQQNNYMDAAQYYTAIAPPPVQQQYFPAQPWHSLPVLQVPPQAQQPQQQGSFYRFP